ncbi:MAG: hypothetical protein WA642_13495, partial [Steroidobacteraceae bacterium]
DLSSHPQNSLLLFRCTDAFTSNRRVITIRARDHEGARQHRRLQTSHPAAIGVRVRLVTPSEVAN